jgi:hypothetical protein
MTDFTRYQPPGVYIEEQSSPIVSVIGAAPTVVAIVGPSVGYRTFAETIVLNGTDETVLAKKGVDALTIEVTRTDGTAYAVGTDYDVTAHSGDDANINTTRDNTTGISAVDGGDITDGEQVRVAYSYTDLAYFDPLHVSDYDDVKDAFGQPINVATGEITSPLSLAAKFALDNGAQNVVLTPTDSSSQVVERSELVAAMQRLSTVYDLSVVVPLPVGIIGQELSPGDVLGVGTDLANHCEQLSNDGYYRIGLLGYETGVTVQPTTIANQVSNERVMLAWPNQVQWFNSFTNQSQTVAGYYLAAAFAGRMVSKPVQDALTKTDIRGFAGIPASMFQTMTKATKDVWSAGGVAVAELNRQQVMVCRHGVSTDTSSTNAREISLTRARDTMMRVIQDTLDASQMIGKAIDDTTPIRVKGIVGGVLETMVTQGVINKYLDLKARQVPDSPVIIEVKFRYKPSYPLNFILVSFSIDTSNGQTTLGTQAA